jgi:hypothetical protein
VSPLKLRGNTTTEGLALNYSRPLGTASSSRGWNDPPVSALPRSRSVLPQSPGSNVGLGRRGGAGSRGLAALAAGGDVGGGLRRSETMGDLGVDGLRGLRGSSWLNDRDKELDPVSVAHWMSENNGDPDILSSLPFYRPVSSSHRRHSNSHPAHHAHPRNNHLPSRVARVSHRNALTSVNPHCSAITPLLPRHIQLGPDRTTMSTVAWTGGRTGGGRRVGV